MKEGRRERNGYDQDEQILVGNQEQVEKNKTTYATQKTGEEKGRVRDVNVQRTVGTRKSDPLHIQQEDIKEQEE